MLRNRTFGAGQPLPVAGPQGPACQRPLLRMGELGAAVGQPGATAMGPFVPPLLSADWRRG